MENWKYLVVDESNEGVLASPYKLEFAIQLAEGFINSRVTIIPLHRTHFKKYRKYNYENDLLSVSIFREVNPLDSSKKTAEFMKNRRIAQRRLSLLETLNTYCYLGRVNSNLGFTHEIAAEIENDLKLCIPEKDVFTPAILEFAHIQQIKPHTAYQELMMRVEGAKLIKIRNYALFDKYLKLINKSGEDELEKIKLLILDEVFLNSMV